MNSKVDWSICRFMIRWNKRLISPVLRVLPAKRFDCLPAGRRSGWHSIFRATTINASTYTLSLVTRNTVTLSGVEGHQPHHPINPSTPLRVTVHKKLINPSVLWHIGTSAHQHITPSPHQPLIFQHNPYQCNNCPIMTYICKKLGTCLEICHHLYLIRYTRIN